MNNLENSGESLLRDKLLQHEFAADERAWEKMDELLATHFPPVPPPAAAPSGLSWIMGGKWILGVVVVGLIGYWSISPQQPEGGDTATLSTDISEPETFLSAKKDSPATFATNNASKDESGKNYNAEIKEENSLSKFSKGNIADKTKNNYNKYVSKNNANVENRKSIVEHEKALMNNEVVSNNSNINTIANTINPTIPNAENIDSIKTLSNISIINFLPARNSLLNGSHYQPVSKVPAFLTNPFSAEHRIQVGVVGGMQVARGQNSQYKLALYATPIFGISANYEVNSSFSLQADALYRNVPFHIRATFGQNNLDASGRLQYWRYSTDANDLEFFEMTLLAKRAFFKDRVHLFGGLRPAYVRPTGIHAGFFATSLYQSYAYFQPPIQQGIRKFDLALTLGADLHIWRKIWIDVRINQGILDLTHDDFFQNTTTDVSTDGQVTLRYYLFAF